MDAVKKDKSLCGAITDELFGWLKAFPEDKCLYNAPSFWSIFVCYQYSF